MSSLTKTPAASGNKVALATQTRPAAGLLQRRCACGNHTPAGGECAACARKNKPIQRQLAIGASNDPMEREADRVADQVLASHSALPTLSAAGAETIRRQEAPKEKTDAEKYQEGLEKLGEAFLQTPLGKTLVEKLKQDALVKGATQLGKDILATWPGRIYTGEAAVITVATLAANHKALPVQIPEIPLDIITPGLSVKLTYKGPVDKPTDAMITFSYREQAAKNDTGKTPLSEADKYRAETAKMAADQAKFRANMRFTPGSPEDLRQRAEDQALRQAALKYRGGPDISETLKKYPWLAVPQPKNGLQLTQPNWSPGKERPSLFGDQFKLRILSEEEQDERPALQKKLRIGASGDPLEMEADRVAEQVLTNSSNPPLKSATPSIQRVSGNGSAAAEAVPDSVDQVLASSGRPLDAPLQQDMEARFGQDFSRVRIHIGGAAEQSAREIQAKAYTVGHDVVFGDNQFQPETREGRHLLAHELAHVVQQRGESRGLRKKVMGDDDPIHKPLIERFRRENGFPPSGEDEYGHQVGPSDAQIKYGGLLMPAARPATPAEQREFVEGAIRFLREAADFYRDVTRIDQTRLATILQGWRTAYTSNLRIIQQMLNNDAALASLLVGAYQAAVASLITKAASLLRRTEQDLYQQLVGAIDEVAWPRGRADPTGAELTNALPEAERQQLRVITLSVTLSNLDAYFQPRATMIPLPANVAVRFSSGVMQVLRRGLENIAGTLTNPASWTSGPPPLEPNSMLTLALHLENVGGGYSAFRFTYVRRQVQGGAANGEILVEHLGGIGMETLHPDQAKRAQQRFDRYNFRRGAGWSDPQFQEVLAALEQVPDTTLNLVAGYTFNRGTVHQTHPEWCGEHQSGTRVITLFDCAFTASLTRTGVPGQGLANVARQDVLHELGHALDLRILSQVIDPMNQAVNAQRNAFRRYETQPGSNRYSIPASMQARWNQIHAQITAAQRTRDAARSLSGSQWQAQPGSNDLTIVEGADNVAFRQAAQQDGGLRITHYSDTSWQEHFAESYALYMVDPDGLQRLRPHVFAFLQSNFPR